MPETADRPSPTARFEIIRERDVPRRRSRSSLTGSSFKLLGSLTGTIRAAIEDVYVTFARGVMRGTEGLEDSLAERRHAGRVRRDGKQLARPSDAPAQIASAAHRKTKA